MQEIMNRIGGRRGSISCPFFGIFLRKEYLISMSRESVSLNQIYLKETPLRLFFRAAVPGAVSMLASSLYQLFDGIFVGRFLGETAFAAVNLVMPFVILAFSVADLIGVGSSVPISIALGRGEDEQANNYFTCACVLIALSGVAIAIVFYPLAPVVVQAMGAEGELVSYAVTYMRVYALCMPFASFIFAMDNYLRICGKTRGSMMMNIAMSLLSFALEYIFLAKLKLGVAGAAFGACFGMITPVAMVVTLFARGKMQLRFIKPKFSLALIKQIGANGTPTFLSNAAARMTSIVMNIVLLRMGGQNAVSIYGVLMYADGIVQPFLYGMCDSLQPAISYNFGARESKRAKAIAKCCVVCAAAICAVGAAGVSLIPNQIAELFLSGSSQELLDMTAHALRLFSLTYITRWVGFIVQSLLVALDRPLPASILSVCNALVFPMLALALLWSLELDGLWLNTPVTCGLVAVLAVGLLMRYRGRLFEREE